MKRLVGICVAINLFFVVVFSNLAAYAVSYVKITYAGQVVDSITYNGVTVNAVYAPYNSISNYDSDTTYCCAAFVKKFYSSVYGVTPYNLVSGGTPTVSGGYFSQTSSPKKGDIVRFNNYTHWAIVKNVSGNTVTIIQQNSWWNKKSTAVVGETISSSSSAYTFFRYSGYIDDGGGGGQIPEPVNDLHAAKNLFSCNEYIEFSWSPSAGATHYYLYMWKDGIQIYMLNNENNTSFTSAPTSAGKYTLIIRPGNDYGYNDNSKAFEFEVYDTIPEAVTDLHAARNRYSKNEYIEFSWSSVQRATHYYLYMWKDGTQIYMLNNGNNTAFTSAPTSPGKYTLIIRPGNDFGYNDNSKSFDFEVYDPDVVPTATPEPTPTPKEPEIPIKTRVITKTATENLSLVNTVYAELENLAARDIGCDVIIVYKYADGSIAKTDVRTVTVPTKQTLNAESSVSNRIIDLGGNLVNSVEVYIWNSADGMIPLAEKKIGSFDYDY